jgi:hypothetical protein
LWVIIAFVNLELLALFSLSFSCFSLDLTCVVCPSSDLKFVSCSCYINIAR